MTRVPLPHAPVPRYPDRPRRRRPNPRSRPAKLPAPRCRRPTPRAPFAGLAAAVHLRDRPGKPVLGNPVADPEPRLAETTVRRLLCQRLRPLRPHRGRPAFRRARARDPARPIGRVHRTRCTRIRRARRRRGSAWRRRCRANAYRRNLGRTPFGFECPRPAPGPQAATRPVRAPCGLPTPAARPVSFAATQPDRRDLEKLTTLADAIGAEHRILVSQSSQIVESSAGIVCDLPWLLRNPERRIKNRR